MDMDMDSTSSSSVAMMVPYLHFAGGDHLIFKSWQPSSAGALAGASIGLFVLCLLERWLSAIRCVMESHWRRRALALASSQIKVKGGDRKSSSSSASSLDESDKCCDESETQKVSTDSAVPSAVPRTPNLIRTIPPFIPSHDLTRGLIHALQALLGYIFMLAVMTFQGAYIISIIAGLGLGEMLFGRMAHVLH